MKDNRHLLLEKLCDNRQWLLSYTYGTPTHHRDVFAVWEDWREENVSRFEVTYGYGNVKIKCPKRIILQTAIKPQFCLGVAHEEEESEISV